MRTIVVALTVLSCFTFALAETPVPYGHPDFYPSTDRPIGWRGDGTGNFPGARVPLEYSQENIVWKTPLPAGFCQPIVVGEKVFVTADPNLLICLSAKDGRILWKRAVDHTDKMPPEMQKKARAEIAFFADVWKQYSQWRTDVEEFKKKVKEKGYNFRNLVDRPWQSGSLILTKYKNWPLRKEVDDKQAAEHDKVLADEELGPELKRLMELQNKYHFAIQQSCNDELVMIYDRRNAGPLRDRYLKANREYDIYFADDWEGYTTWSFATPCSDGQSVYVTTVNNAVACYDLNGNQKWLVWEHPKKGGGRLHTRFVASPVLYKDKLIVNQNSHLRVYDKRSGEKIWESISPYDPTEDHQRSTRSTPEASSPVATTLSLPDGGTLDVVMDAGGHDRGEYPYTGGHIYRLLDGTILSDDLSMCNRAATPAVRGDLYFWATGKDGGPNYMGADKLIAKSRYSVEVKHVWKAKVSGLANASLLVDDKHVYWVPERRGSYRYDLLTGKAEKFVDANIRRKHCSGILAGSRLVHFDTDKFYHHRTGKRLGEIDMDVADVTTGKFFNRNVLKDLRLFEDEDWFQRNRWVGCPNQNSNGSPTAQANRIFYRSKGYLWALGDPSQPFPTPKNCPPQAKVRKP